MKGELLFIEILMAAEAAIQEQTKTARLRKHCF